MGTVAHQHLTATQRGAILVAGEESVGRQIRLRSVISKQFVTGRLTDFCPEFGQHKFTSEDGREEWVSLGQRAYQWVSPVPSNAMPNPTFKNFPGNHEAIGWKVRVYWNEMGRWYAGRIRAYDQMTRLHHVVFFDGDDRWYTIRNEAVEWIEKMNNKKKPQSSSGEWGQNVSATAPEGSETDEQRRIHNEIKTTTRNGRPRNGRNAHTTVPNATSLLEVNQSGRVQNGPTSVCRSVLPSGMTLRPLRNPNHDQLMDKNSAHCILQNRVGIYWPNDKKYYKGTLVSYNEETEKYGLHYDDEQEEEVELEKEDFKWLGPKSISAGYTSKMKEIMILHGAKNIRNDRLRSTLETTNEPLLFLSQPKELIGRRLMLNWEATGENYEAEILTYDCRRKQHYLLYRDGELEWVDLRKERFSWCDDNRLSKEFPAGLEEGQSIPRRRAAVGWRIAVYWPEDVEFYDGRITKYHTDTGRHDVDYDDGTHETLSLSLEKIVWKASPTPTTVTAVFVQSKEESETTTTTTTPKAPTSHKTTRGTLNGPAIKRPRLPSPSSSDLAKENKAIQIDPSLAMRPSAEDVSSLSFGKFFAGSRSLKTEESDKIADCEYDEDLDLYPIVQIPPEPLPPVQHTRLAKLPPEFGAAMFQVKIIATSAKADSEQDCGMEQLTACVHDYHSAFSKIGRVPSAVEAAATSMILPKGVVTVEYPTKDMTGMETVALRTGPPLQRRTASCRSRGRKKGRSQKSDIDALSASLDSVLGPFPSLTSIDTTPLSDGRLRSLDMDYSRTLFDAAASADLGSSFMDMQKTMPPTVAASSGDGGYLLRDTIGSTVTNTPTLEQRDGEAAV